MEVNHTLDVHHLLNNVSDINKLVNLFKGGALLDGINMPSKVGERGFLWGAISITSAIFTPNKRGWTIDVSATRD
ncbi:hypothetical protein TUM4630_06330 [Shewanella algidipiscicola]|uniref:Uncharacterized protein n=1 Tax=Shewanella algidipiscicola TaxID=614070 RepID=A0ABQ4P703_9GAMM|nr:hypothetical protein TUM4630_06330 [Shewanella algidipiscicola]